VNVILTIVLIVAVAMWTIAIYSRLVRLRNQVTQAWKRLEADQSNDAIRTVYNKQVDAYNNALANVFGGLIGIAAGFKPAKRF
jgi:hypothetical protein